MDDDDDCVVLSFCCCSRINNKQCLIKHWKEIRPQKTADYRKSDIPLDIDSEYNHGW